MHYQEALDRIPQRQLPGFWVGDVAGLVERLTLRTTVLRDLKGRVHFIPHGQIATVTNFTHGWSSAVFDIGVAMVFCGDTLFQGSIGRTDFRMGSFEELEQSIRTRLYTLPDNTIVYTGHGPPTTIGTEKQFNPFVRL